MSNFARILAAIVIAAFSVGPVSAATLANASTTVAQAATTGAVTGTALDESGAPVAGADVTVRGAQTYTAMTDAKGTFSIENIAPGLYVVSVRKAGFETATQPDFAIFAGEKETLAVTMHSATLTTLRTIASIRAVGRGTFNTSTASVNAVTSQQFADQGQPQVIRVLSQIPGVQISLPQSSANGASPGAITFPNIRGGLSFETASLIDGHPVSVGQYGDYVTTFLSPYMLQGVDIIKGPGAMAPQVNYAIGGTANFRTKDPTATITPDYTFGIDNHGGSFFNFGVSDTIGRVGFVVDVAGTNYTNAINNYQATFVPSGAVVSNGVKTGKLGFNDSAVGFVPGTQSKYYNTFGLVACCLPISGTFNGLNELLKVRYKFSNATTATVSYLGSQTLSDQNANTGSLSPGVFAPAGAYGGSLTVGSPVETLNIFPVYNREINNEPILQAEVRSTLGNDTVLARFYHAGIQRLKREGGDCASCPDVVPLRLNGYDSALGSFNGQTYSAKYYDYYNNPEIDSLNGLSFEYDHPIGDNNLTFAFDQTNSTTTTYSVQDNVNSSGAFTGTSVNGGVPSGSSQLFTTFMERGRFQVNPKLAATLSLYENTYRSTYLQNCGPVNAPVTCTFDGTGAPTNSPFFTTSNKSHFDQRLGLEFRPASDLAVRFSVGSAIAPPYIGLYGTYTSAPSVTGTNTYATQRHNNADLAPETAFGYDLGSDYRFKDGKTVLSGDLYLTNLFNQFISGYTFNSGITCGTSPIACNGATATPSTPILYTSNVNLSNSRYEGVELALKRVVEQGLGFSVSGAVTRAYAYNLPSCFYGTDPKTGKCAFNSLLAIVPNQNFTGGQPSQGFSTNGTFGGVSNQNIPYLTGNVELTYTLKNGAFLQFGDTLYGKNNSFNEPPLGIAYASVRYPLSRTVSLQISGDNIFNAYPNLFPTVANGVAIPLANGGSAATTAGNVGPANYRFILTKNIGPEPVNQ